MGYYHMVLFIGVCAMLQQQLYSGHVTFGCCSLQRSAPDLKPKYIHKLYYVLSRSLYKSIAIDKCTFLFNIHKSWHGERCGFDFANILFALI